MPAFPERASALLSRLDKKSSAAGDKRTWAITGKDATPGLDRSATLKRNFSNSATATLNGINGTNGANGNTAKTPIDELAGLDLTSGSTNLASAAHLSPGWEEGYNRLLMRPEGLLYEDAQIQVGCRTEYRAEVGCVILYFTNKSPAPIQSFTTTIDNPSAEQLKAETKSLPETKVHTGEQTSQMVIFTAHGIFNESPTVRISYMAGSLQALTLKLPLALHKYMDTAVLSSDDFFKRWKQIGGAPRESQKIFKAYDISTDSTRRLLIGLKWGILDGVDPNPRNFVGATVLHTTGSKFGCLLRLEPNHENKMYRLTIRATDEAVPPILMKMMEERLREPFPQ